MAGEIERFGFDGTMDADGHFLEPPRLSEEELPRHLKEWAMRIAVDDEGYEYLEIDDRPSRPSKHRS